LDDIDEWVHKKKDKGAVGKKKNRDWKAGGEDEENESEEDDW
jgi:hypothetical protein